MGIDFFAESFFNFFPIFKGIGCLFIEFTKDSLKDSSIDCFVGITEFSIEFYIDLFIVFIIEFSIEFFIEDSIEFNSDSDSCTTEPTLKDLYILPSST